jgi:hypothetical protein
MLSYFGRIAKKLGICRYPATRVAREFHRRKFIRTYFGCCDPAEFIVDFLVGRIAEATGIICIRATVLTCIGHGNPPSLCVVDETVSRQWAFLRQPVECLSTGKKTMSDGRVPSKGNG